MSLFSELRRRKVVRTAVVYVALGWVGIEVSSTLGQIFAWPDWLMRGAVVVIVLGLPVAIVISWMFDLTPDGFLPDSRGGARAAESQSMTTIPIARDEAEDDLPESFPPLSKPAPAQGTDLLGRSEALETASERLRSGVRVLTITGPGGTGKTRFAREVFECSREEYPGGFAWISLAAVERSEYVMPTVAAALDIPEAHGRSAVHALATRIGDRRVLLLLDNLEQVLDVAGEVAELVSHCAALQVIATSRAPLKIAAEVELTLPPLALPPGDSTPTEDLTLYPAVELFVQRATKVKSDFRLTAENGPAVVGICRRLDGLPLALELAAARIRILDPQALLARLDNALDVLTSGDRDLPKRQRTLRATVDWSYSLLDDGEQQLLRRMCVFHEGWTFNAMEAVCYHDGGRTRALDELDSLAEKGLVQVATQGGRYGMLETIREFAAEQLDASGDAGAIQRAHADFFTLATEQIYRGILGRGQLEAMDRARADHANIMAALSWLVSRAQADRADALAKALLMCGHLAWFWHIAGHHLTARSIVDTLLALSEDHEPTLGRSLSLLSGSLVSAHTGELERAAGEARASYAQAKAVGDRSAMTQADLGLGFVELMRGRFPEARTALEDGISLAEAIGDEFFVAFINTVLGILLGATDDETLAIQLLEESRAVQARIEDYEGRGLTLSGLAQIMFAQGKGDRALEYYRSALESFETVGDKPEIARVHGEMGWAALAQHQENDARSSFLRSLRVCDEVGSSRGIGLALAGLAATEAQEGNAERAVLLATAAEVLSEQTGVVVEHPMGPGAGDQIAAVKANLTEDVIEVLIEQGTSMSASEVFAMVARPASAHAGVEFSRS